MGEPPAVDHGPWAVDAYEMELKYHGRPRTLSLGATPFPFPLPTHSRPSQHDTGDSNLRYETTSSSR